MLRAALATLKPLIIDRLNMTVLKGILNANTLKAQEIREKRAEPARKLGDALLCRTEKNLVPYRY